MHANATASSRRFKQDHGGVAPVRLPIAAWSLAALLGGAGLVLSLAAADAADRQQVAHGKYMVSLMGCTDCHTPGHFFGKEDSSKYLAGSDVGFAVPGLGVFVGPNITSDKEPGSATGPKRKSSPL